MPLKVGDKAPDFTLTTKTDKGLTPVKLSDQWGKKYVVLLFFPMVYTGVCKDEMCAVSSDLGSFGKLNAAVFGISGDNPFAQEAWAQANKITVPLLSDYDHKVARAYGVAYDSFLPQLNLGYAGVAKRSAFVVDQTGVIRYAESNDDPKILPNFEAIQRCLAGLK